jgi:hypothetical protein
MADDSALVIVAPNDNVDAIVEKIRGSGADRIQLLVPDGTPALQALGGFARLRQSLGPDWTSLLVITSDEKTLNAARLNQLDTMGVEGTRVAFPAAGNGGQADRYATQVLPRQAGATPPVADRDTEFLQALDQMPPSDRYAAEEDADLYAALDDLSTAVAYQAAVDRGERSADEDFAAALDEWSGTDGAQPSTDDEWSSTFAETSQAPRRRVRAEDLEVSADELERQRGSRRTAAQRTRTAETSSGSATAPRRARTTSRLLDLEEAEEAAPRRSLMSVIPLLVLLLVVVVGAIWYLRSRATIVVVLPAARTTAHPFNNEVIPVASSGTAKSPDAVQAVPASADAEFSVQGQVISQTLAPATTAKGVVVVINRTGQAIPLPEGTQFVAVKDQGQEVRFKLDQAATVPAATTTNSLTGSNTTFGSVELPVTALSPGSASNVGENAIKQILIPGQQPIATDTSNFVLRNAPIAGGEDRPVRIVTDADVQRTLREALTGLYNEGVRALQGRIDAQKQGIDPVSIYPDANSLGDPKNYEVTVDPSVGQQVDENNPIFNVKVKTRFSALATPREASVTNQLQTALQQHLNPRSPCKAGEKAVLGFSDYHWDGTKLTADALITCTPSPVLTPETIAMIKSAVRGKSRAEAESSLRDLQKKGLIGAYQLPADRDQFPSPDFLLTVEQGQSGQPQPTPAAQ